MTKQIADRKRYIPFSLAAQTVGIPETRLRNWLLRDQVYLDADELRPNTTIHRRFSRLDVLRLGLIAILTDLGYNPKRASEIVEGAIYKALWDRNRAELFPNPDHGSEFYRASVVRNTPESEIIKRLATNTALTITPGDKAARPPFWTSNEKPESVVQIVIDIGLMMKKQLGRFRAAEPLHGFTAEMAAAFADEKEN
jgi:MerR HTH family regulatory protein